MRELDELRWGLMQEMAAYFQSLWIERTMDKEPGNDLISMMIHSEAMNQMRPEEFMGNLVLLIVGGNDTTRNTMSGIIHALDKFPDQRKLYEEQPELIPNAVQEILRMQVPLAHMRRTCTEDTEVFGQTIKAGDKVVLCTSAPTATRRCSRTQTSSTSPARTPAATSPSATASTAAWAQGLRDAAAHPARGNAQAADARACRGGCRTGAGELRPRLPQARGRDHHLLMRA